MKKFMMASMTLAVLMAPAMAADKVLLKAPPKAAPVIDWTGYYIGAHVGYGWLSNDVSDGPTVVANDSAPTLANIRANKWLGGAQWGYNKQIGSVVVGYESDFTWFKPSGSATAPNLFPNGTPVGSGGVQWTSGIKWLSSSGLRFGILATPSVLVFATAGVGAADVTGSATHAFLGGCPNCAVVAPFSSVVYGIEVGGGVEFMIGGNWLLRGDYKYYQLSGQIMPSVYQNAGPLLGTSVASFNWGTYNIQIARAALSYKL